MRESHDIIWNAEAEQWVCPKCGGQGFFQTVEASNIVTFRTGDKTTLVESDDFTEEWQIMNRHPVTCKQCWTELDIPDEVETVEEWEWRRRNP